MASLDFFTVPTVTFRILYVFLILSHSQREIIHYNITDSPSSVWTARQLIQAFPWDTAPRLLLPDRDGIHGLEVQEAAYNLGCEQIRTSPRSPWQNLYVERVIGSMRRECLDKDYPAPRSVQPPGMGKVVAIPQVGGLHHRYTRIAA